MTNVGALAILAELHTYDARLRTARAYSLLIALETFPPGADGWREVGADLLCKSAGLNWKSFRQARGELIAAKLIEYRPGAKKGEMSRWRITFPVEEPGRKGATQSGPLTKGATQSGPSTRVHTRPGKGARPAPNRGPDPEPAPEGDSGLLASQDAAPEADSGRSTALEASALEPSLSARTRMRDTRTLLLGLGADEREIGFIIAKLEADDRIVNPYIWLLTVVGNGDGPAWLDRMRRDLGAQDAGDDPRPPKPPWCRECDSGTRLVELRDGRMARCIRCHPLSASRTPATADAEAQP